MKMSPELFVKKYLMHLYRNRYTGRLISFNHCSGYMFDEEGQNAPHIPLIPKKGQIVSKLVSEYRIDLTNSVMFFNLLLTSLLCLINK